MRLPFLRPRAFSQPDRRSDGARRDGGGGDLPGTYPDIKMEYRNDGNRYKVALDAEENPEFRYQVIPWHSSYLPPLIWQRRF